MKKKILVGVLAVVLLLVVVVVGLGISAFGGIKPVEEGARLGRATVLLEVGFVSMYLVDVGDGKFVLVDGGVDTEATTVKAALAANGAAPDSIIAVVLTHGHSDHIGAAYALDDVPLYAHKADVPLVEGRTSPKGFIGKLGGPNPTGLVVDHPYEDGDLLRFGDATFEVFLAPGHTPGNSALLIDDVLLLGDTAQVTDDDRLHSPPTFFSDDPEQAIASIRALAREIESRETKPTILVGSHSGSTRTVDALLKYDGDP